MPYLRRRQPRHHYTYEDYLEFEKGSGSKHEFENGEIFAMAGGTKRHNALAFRVATAMASMHGRCTGFQSDQRIRIRNNVVDKAVYPDVSVVCGKIESDAADRDAIVNPILIVEVMSPSTEEYDRGDKWEAYQMIPSLEEYVLVSQGGPRIERYRRNAEGGWQYWDAHEGRIELTIGAVLDIAQLYRELPES
jgi:Uma2 family endonuclease